MSHSLTRRDFLKLSGLSLASLAWPRLPGARTVESPGDPIRTSTQMRARVTVDSIFIFADPDFQSARIGTAARDTLLDIYGEIISSAGPAYNPRWYRLAQGYVHSGNCQRVEKAHLNEPLNTVPEAGLLAEVTVPISQTLRQYPGQGWLPLYRLYYESVHWITGLEEGPDGKVWYRLTDERLHTSYIAPAVHFRPIQASELFPLSAEIPAEQKRLVVSLAEQMLTAFEAGRAVRVMQISSGSHGNTPTGIYHIMVKAPSKHMGDGRLTDDYRAYELLGVPWAAFFHGAGIGFHGTFWHDDFGHAMSHGCINLRNEDAKWLYRWSTPFCSSRDWSQMGYGTRVDIS